MAVTAGVPVQPEDPRVAEMAAARELNRIVRGDWEELGDSARAEWCDEVRPILAAAGRVGICGHHPPRIHRATGMPTCTLPAGHEGWHHDDVMRSDWTGPSDDKAELVAARRALDDVRGWLVANQGVIGYKAKAQLGAILDAETETPE